MGSATFAEAPASQPAQWIEPATKPLAVYHAKGVQIYTLIVGADGKPAWNKPSVPDAVLSDDAGNAIGHHYKGPTWEINDGAIIAGQKMCERPSTNPASIPELQLSVKTTQGSGAISKADLVERLNTKGGIAPAVPTDAKPGDEVRVAYTADYAFFSTHPANP